MSDRVEALPGEPVTSPDALALAKRVARKAWPYAAGLVVVLAVLGIVFHASLSWGDVATWVVAITTLLAFLAAAFAGLVAYDLLKVENARDMKAAEERLVAAADRRLAEHERAAQREADRRAQASKITAWFELYHDDKYELIDKAWALPSVMLRSCQFWMCESSSTGLMIHMTAVRGPLRLFHPNLGWEPVNLYVMRRVRWSTPWPKRPLSTGVTARSLGDARPAAPAPPPAGCHEQSAVDRADRAGRLGELSLGPQTTPPAWQTGWRAPDPILCVSQRSGNSHVIVSKAPRLAGRQRRPPISATS